MLISCCWNLFELFQILFIITVIYIFLNVTILCHFPLTLFLFSLTFILLTFYISFWYLVIHWLLCIVISKNGINYFVLCFINIKTILVGFQFLFGTIIFIYCITPLGLMLLSVDNIIHPARSSNFVMSLPWQCTLYNFISSPRNSNRIFDCCIMCYFED